MTVGKAIYYLLTNASDVTAIVGTRIYPEVAQQNAALPYIVYNVSNNEPSDTKREPSKLDTAEVEVNVFSEKYTQAIDMGVAVRAALDRVKGTYSGVNVQSIQYINEIIDFDEPQRAYNITADYEVRISRTDFEIAQGSPITGVTLGELSDVSVAGVTDNQILSYDAATGNWVPADDAGGLVDSVNGLTGTVILNFDDLNDVDTGTPSDGQLIAYQQGEWVTIDQDEIHIPINSVTGLQTELNTIPTDLSDLSDVSIVGTPAGNQALIYNSATNAFTSQDSYTNRFQDEVETGKQGITGTERAYSVKGEGDGVFIDPESDTPAAGKVIVRKIYHKTGFITDADVIGDYTLIHTFADDTAYADTVATFEGFEDGATYGVPPFTLLQTWEEVAAAPTFTGLLNETYGSGAEAAYSTRRLNGNVTDCMVIRRASDSTTTTIGFDGSGNISEADIISFCTGTTCTVYQWLDQSGNGNTATAAAPANEPTIYTGGALVKESGKVAVDFDGSDDYFEMPPVFTGTNPRTAFFTGYSNETPSSETVIFGADFHSTTEAGKNYNITTEIALRVNQYAQWNDSYQATSLQLLTTNWTAGTALDANIYLDGVELSTSAGNSTVNLNTGTHTQSLICLAPYGSSNYLTAVFSEMIFYASDKSGTDQTSIEENIGDYFTQNTPLLDTYSGAAAAYSLRLLDSSYVGSAIRVRRSSDNTEQDIGFNVFGELDTVSLLDFAGTGDAFVKTWYDQSGNSNDATQTVTGSQPQIVSSGAVITENGKPVVEFISKTLNVPNSATSSTMFAFSVFKTNDVTTEQGVYNFNANGSLSLNRGGNGVICMRNGNVGSSGTTATPHLVSAHHGTKVFIDGTQATTSVTGRLSNSNTLGRANYHLNGFIQEFIVYLSDESDNRAGIESNLNTFYNIYS